MSIQIALNHQTHYRYDRIITLGPQVIRLRPAPHCRTPILSYSLKVTPQDHFINWQQDPHGNFLARCVFPKATKVFSVEVDLVADMTIINPFDFFLEDHAKDYPLVYEAALAKELKPYLETITAGPKMIEFLASIDLSPLGITDFVVALNGRLQRDLKYVIRMEPGVQTPEQTLSLCSGSCRDSAWLLVQTLRHLGLAARFVSGYLLQLTPDIKALDGPTGADNDFTDLHAWAEVFIPGAGWVGLDPTSGLLASEGHIPLACTPDPGAAAPISGALDECESEFQHAMSVTRIREQPRVTKPYREDQWAAINEVGYAIDQRLNTGDVRLTMGGEPTFVSIDDMEGEEWNNAAVGPNKRRLSENLIHRLRERFAPGGLLHFGTGKWYPGESLPRWALSCFWRKDGVPIWEDVRLIARPDVDYRLDLKVADTFLHKLCQLIGVSTQWIIPAYEDTAHYLLQEHRLPIDLDPRATKVKTSEDRARLARVISRGLDKPAGFVLPLRRAWWQANSGKTENAAPEKRLQKSTGKVAEKSAWLSGPWPVRPERFFLLPGDSPVGLRLPLDSLPWVPAQQTQLFPASPLDAKPPLSEPAYRQSTLSQASVPGAAIANLKQGISQQAGPGELQRARRAADDQVAEEKAAADQATREKESLGKASAKTDHDTPSADGFVVRTAVCAEVRDGKLHVFMPPVEHLEHYLDLISAIESVAAEMQTPVVIEGYLPPHDARMGCIKVTPDPGVIEVNVHPVETWEELRENTLAFYEDARQSRLGTEKFDLDGKHTGTGGGNHVVLGGSTPADSPFLRRPDLLKSMIGYWLNHPALSYLFSSRFIGPTSQAPRVDEGRKDALYELELAFAQIPPQGQNCPPWLVDRVLRNLLIDLTGNTHRAEFCIDKLYSPDSSTGRLGLLELRGFEMPPHPQMSLTQQLLVRGLIAKFWEQPWQQRLVDWGTSLHDRFLLPHFVWQDLGDVVSDLQQAGFAMQLDWFTTHLEFRFPHIGALQFQDLRMELRSAIEPWYVLGEEPGGGGTVRFVDSSVERLEVKVENMVDSRHVVACNGRRVPLRPTGVPGQFVAGVRYRAWCPPSGLHPTIPVHSPLVFDLIDTWSGRSVAGCTYHVTHPAGRHYSTFPVNANEAEARRTARFFQMGHTPGPCPTPLEEINPVFPLTLDLRRPAPFSAH